MGLKKTVAFILESRMKESCTVGVLTDEAICDRSPSSSSENSYLKIPNIIAGLSVPGTIQDNQVKFTDR